MKMLVASLLLATIFTTGEGFPHRFETAPYEMVATYEGFEERVYSAQKWVSTTLEADAWYPNKDILYVKLQSYFYGYNDQDAIIPLTTPVSTLVEPLSSGYRYTMAFYVPSAYQEDVPNGGSEIAVEDRPQQNILTRRFSGFAYDDEVAAEVKALEELIRAAGLGEEVDFTTYYLAVYDGPFIIVGAARRNEVWFVRKTPAANKA